MTEVCAWGGSVNKFKVKVLRNKNHCFKRKKYVFILQCLNILEREGQKGQEGIMLHTCMHIQNLVQPGLEMKVNSIEISDSEAQNLLKGK